MKNLAQFLDLDLLKSLPTMSPVTPAVVAWNSCPYPPHTLLENPSSYSIVMNLLGIDEKDIAIRVDQGKREIAVLAKKETKNTRRGFFWIFGVPAGLWLYGMSTRYKNGVLEITVPKQSPYPFGHDPDFSQMA